LVQTVDGIGVQVGSIVGGDEAAPFGGVIPGVAVVQAGIFVVVIATITNRVGVRYSRIAGNGAVALHLYSTIIYASSQEKASQVECDLGSFRFDSSKSTPGFTGGKIIAYSEE
jgi:Na+/citrate or Na+/malate symporter